MNESYLRILEDKVKAYEGVPDTVTKNRRSTGPSRRQTREEEFESDEEIEDEHPLLESFNQMSVDRLSTSKSPAVVLCLTPVLSSTCPLPLAPPCHEPLPFFQ